MKAGKAMLGQWGIDQPNPLKERGSSFSLTHGGSATGSCRGLIVGRWWPVGESYQ
ncbi:MAG: hypothetical protein WCJ35_27950 [Planctomycetota bacterium]